MKKIIYGFIFVVSIFILLGCKQDSSIYNKYYSGSPLLNYNLYYQIDTYEELISFNNIYLGVDAVLESYDEAYFKDKVLFAFNVSQSSGGSKFELTSNKLELDGTLVINYKQVSEGMTCDMAYYSVLYEFAKDKASSVKKLCIASSKHESILTEINDYETLLPKNMSDNIELFVSLSGPSLRMTYDSRTSKLIHSNGTEVELNLSKDNFKDIYNLLRDVTFDKYPNTIYVEDAGKLNLESIDLSIYLTVDDARYNCHIRNISSFEQNSWQNHQELGNALSTILYRYFFIN